MVKPGRKKPTRPRAAKPAARPARPRPEADREAKAGPEAPKRSEADRGKRLLDLVVLLLGTRTALPFREIRAQFSAYRTEKEEAGLRAFERDKADLLELGVPLRYVTPEEDESLDEAGYTVDLGRYRLPEIRLEPEEVAALVLAGAIARSAPGSSYAEVADLALEKLRFDRPDSPAGRPAAAARRPREPVLVHFGRPADAARLAERLALVEAAVRNRKRLDVGYHSASGHKARRDVDPYGLVHRQGTWLLVGHCHLRRGVRTFRLDRIESLAVAPKPRTPDFERPRDFDLRRFVNRSPWTFEIEGPLDVELEVSPAAAAILAEDFGAAERDALPGGGARLRFRSGNPDYIIARALSAQGALVVLGPPALRGRLEKEIDAILEQYQ